MNICVPLGCGLFYLTIAPVKDSEDLSGCSECAMTLQQRKKDEGSLGNLCVCVPVCVCVYLCVCRDNV